jgi:hypothetical protein
MKQCSGRFRAGGISDYISSALKLCSDYSGLYNSANLTGFYLLLCLPVLGKMMCSVLLPC